MQNQRTIRDNPRANMSTIETSLAADSNGTQHIVVTFNKQKCEVVKISQYNYDIITKNCTDIRLPATSQLQEDSPLLRQRTNAGQVNRIRIFPGHQVSQPSPQRVEAHEWDLLEERREGPWSPHQTYDNKGTTNFQQNSDGVVLTSPSGHTYCAYCHITSHPRESCLMRAKHLSQNIDRLYHPAKGIAKSKNQKYRYNKSANQEFTADITRSR